MVFNAVAEYYHNISLLGETTTTDIISIVLILLGAFIIIRIVKNRLKRSFGDQLPKSDLDFVMTLSTYLIYLITILLLLPYLHFDLSGLFVAGGIVALALAFATQNIVSNLVSGLFLMFERPIKIGDNVTIGSLTGTVQNIQIMSTIVRTYDGIFVRIPNSKMFTSDITNLVAHPARRFEYTVGIRYQDDAAKAIALIKNLIDRQPYALKSPGPSVYVDKLDDSSVNIVVKVWAPSLFWWDLRTALLWKIKVELEKNGIQIPFPQRELWFDNTLKTDMKTVQPPPIREVPYQEADDHLEVGKPRPGETHDW
ncbi:MAG: mechanosensitive ion channel family protein [Methanofollis liminatans]|uniref:MscS Mechanosensitive ion channel n=1 Tax=Methanofollis liminatans DSM 4140 TaxID=28892 RepID=J0SAG7_9EURY|nr:mechanosensitive ion channel family protein [Methanofollis liminatans]EJG07674.1 MscS Mechanosensitive ion channel [Methanofollis liminatans DSM 4140]MDD3112265.1 mechanosensitive ion channel family protein [Methanofollis liminatans]